MSKMHTKTELKRELGLSALCVYGIGSILGAGIYTVIGEVATVAGGQFWISFCIALVVALLTGLSYAELGRRFPQSGAESNFAQHAFGQAWFSSLIGWLIVCSSTVSMATLSHAFAGYLTTLWASHWALPSREVVIVIFLGVMGAINLCGIRESSRANLVATTIEVSGLLIVLLVGAILIFQGGFVSANIADVQVFESKTGLNWMHGAALAFFAFIGFEDIVNVADEVKKPERDLPIAILIAACVAGLLYVLVAWVTSQVVPVQVLGSSGSPLLEVIKRGTLSIPHWLFAIIALFAVANTALLNSITASRLLYGMSHQKLLPLWLGRVHTKRQTPHFAIFVVIPAAMVLAIFGSLGSLAGTTSLILLSVFTVMNIALAVIQFKKGPLKKGFRVPRVIPILGAMGTLAILFFIPIKSQFVAMVMGGSGLVLLTAYRYFRGKNSFASSSRT